MNTSMFADRIEAGRQLAKRLEPLRGQDIVVFEEPGTLDQVAVLARDWFVDHLGPAASG